MIHISVIVYIILGHFLSDFILQDEKWATTKSKNIWSLTKHVLVYSLTWLLMIIYLGVIGGLIFVGITFICHWLTDFFTSKATHFLSENKIWGSSIPNLGFFSMIGFDQVLHYLQLFLTFLALQ